MKKSLPVISIVIATYNGKALLRTCLRSVLKSDYPSNRLEILCVDNASQDGSIAFLTKKFPQVKILPHPVNSYSRANNLGIRMAKGAFVVLLNNDTRCDPRWLKELLRVMDERKDAGAVGSKILFPDGRLQSVGHQEYPNFYWGDRGFNDTDKGQYDFVQEVPSLCGASVMYRRACLEQVGHLDEDFDMYLEDVDMGIRLRQKGWKLYCAPASRVYHQLHGTIRREEDAKAHQEQNRLLLIAKHWPEKLAGALQGQAFFVEKGIEEERSLYQSLGRVYEKLVKEHDSLLVSRVTPAIFGQLHNIMNFEKDQLIQNYQAKSAEAKALRLSFQEEESKNHELSARLVALERDIISLREERDALRESEMAMRPKEHGEEPNPQTNEALATEHAIAEEGILLRQALQAQQSLSVEQMAELKEKISRLEHQLATTQEEANRWQDKAQDLQKTQYAMEEQFVDLNRKLELKDRNFRKLDEAWVAAGAQLDAAFQNESSRIKEIERLNRDLAEHMQTKVKQQARIEALKRERDLRDSQILDLRKIEERQRAQATEIQELKEQHAEKLESLLSERAELVRVAETQKDLFLVAQGELQARMRELQEKVDFLSDKREMLNQENINLTNEKQKLEQEQHALQKELVQNKERLDALGSACTLYEQIVTQTHRVLDARQQEARKVLEFQERLRQELAELAQVNSVLSSEKQALLVRSQECEHEAEKLFVQVREWRQIGEAALADLVSLSEINSSMPQLIRAAQESGIVRREDFENMPEELEKERLQWKQALGVAIESLRLQRRENQEEHASLSKQLDLKAQELQESQAREYEHRKALAQQQVLEQELQAQRDALQENLHAAESEIVRLKREVAILQAQVDVAATLEKEHRQVLSMRNERIHDLEKTTVEQASHIARQEKRIFDLDYLVFERGREIEQIYAAAGFRYLLQPIRQFKHAVVKAGKSVAFGSRQQPRESDAPLPKKSKFSKPLPIDLSFKLLGATFSPDLKSKCSEYEVILENRTLMSETVKLVLDIYPLRAPSHPLRHFGYFAVKLPILPQSRLGILIKFDWQEKAEFYHDHQSLPVIDSWLGNMPREGEYTVYATVQTLQDLHMAQASITEELVSPASFEHQPAQILETFREEQTRVQTIGSALPGTTQPDQAPERVEAFDPHVSEPAQGLEVMSQMEEEQTIPSAVAVLEAPILKTDASDAGQIKVIRPAINVDQAIAKGVPLRPQNVSMKFTNNCQLKCKMCDIWQEEKQAELSTDEWKTVITKMKDWLGSYHLDVAGGEPLLRKDTEELIRFAVDQGLTTTMLSNANLITEKRAQSILDSGLDNINISLDSLKPTVFNHMRGVPKTYKRLMEAIARLKRLRKARPKKFNICLATIVMEPNLDELVDLAKYVYYGGAEVICFQALDDNFHSVYESEWFKQNKYWIKDTDKLNRVMDQLIELKLKGYPISNSAEHLEYYKKYFTDPIQFNAEVACLTGEKNFIIRNTGEVQLCWNLPPVGHILQAHPEDLWLGETAMTRREDIHACERTCRILNCHFKSRQ